jgi:hypothetical protein
MMSLKGQLGEAVLKRIAAIPAVQTEMERAERRMPVLRAARDAAYSSLDDEQAQARVAQSLDADASVIEDALELLERQRSYCYIEDRAYRLLAAAAAGTAVAPIQPEHAELFAEEESIGRMPIERAFQRLAEIEPQLLELEQQARTARPSKHRGEGALDQIDQSLRRLARTSDHELLRTILAANIAGQYLYLLADDTLLGTPETAFFDNPNGIFVPRRSERREP